MAHYENEEQLLKDLGKLSELQNAELTTKQDTSSFTKQEGGSHYTDMKLQPLEMTLANFGYAGLKASVYTKVNKYILRKKDDEVAQLNKAIHCLTVLRDEAIKLKKGNV